MLGWYYICLPLLCIFRDKSEREHVVDEWTTYFVHPAWFKYLQWSMICSIIYSTDPTQGKKEGLFLMGLFPLWHIFMKSTYYPCPLYLLCFVHGLVSKALGFCFVFLLGGGGFALWVTGFKGPQGAESSVKQHRLSRGTLRWRCRWWRCSGR